jgi:hypothetical protein
MVRLLDTPWFSTSGHRHYLGNWFAMAQDYD